MTDFIRRDLFIGGAGDCHTARSTASGGRKGEMSAFRNNTKGQFSMATITTKDSHKIYSKKRAGFRHRIPALLAIGALVSVGLAAADDDGSIRPPAPAAVAPTNTPNDFAPMTRSERLSNYLVGLGNYEGILFSAASGGIQQAEGTPKEWGGGAAAYGDRFGSSFAQHVIRRTLTYGLSSALHEDNRYFVSHETGFFRRTKYAIKSTFLARHDNGSQFFSFSRIGGAAGAAFISREWQPPSTTSAGDGATSFGISMASDIGFNVFREFWPDMKRHLHKGR